MLKPVKPDPDKNILTAAEAMWYLGIRSYNTLKKHTLAGDIPAKQKPNRGWLYSKDALDEWIKGDQTIGKVIAKSLFGKH